MTILFEHLFFTQTGFDLFANLFLYFSFFAVWGWLIEMAYLSTAGRGLINSGFLQGPFCPAYAFGGILIYPLVYLTAAFPLWLQLIAFALLCSLVEYTAHFALEKILGIRIWDYTDEPFNLHGRISLKYTFFWFLLMFALMLFIQPGTVTLITIMPTTVRNIFFGIFVVVIPIDYIYSMVVFGKLSKTINTLCEKLNLPQAELHDLQFNRPRIMKEKKRIKKFFKNPDYVKLDEEIREKVLVDKIFEKDPAFAEAIRDIRENPLFKDWHEDKPVNRETYIRHLRIAELSWKFCGIMGLDKVTAARGALICAYKRKKMTPKGRASSALFPQTTVYLWVKKDFSIENKIEKDVILWYKWPLNFKAPNSLEALMVSFADKIMKSLEFRQVVQQLYRDVLEGETSPEEAATQE